MPGGRTLDILDDIVVCLGFYTRLPAPLESPRDFGWCSSLLTSPRFP